MNQLWVSLKHHFCHSPLNINVLNWLKSLFSVYILKKIKMFPTHIDLFIKQHFKPQLLWVPSVFAISPQSVWLLCHPAPPSTLYPISLHSSYILCAPAGGCLKCGPQLLPPLYTRCFLFLKVPPLPHTFSCFLKKLYLFLKFFGYAMWHGGS